MTKTLIGRPFPPQKYRLPLLAFCLCFFTNVLPGQAPKSWCDVANVPGYWDNLESNSGCGGLQLTTSIENSNVCNGEQVHLKIIPPTTGDSILICWGDGNFTQVKTGTQTDFYHKYVPTDPCPDQPKQYKIRTASIKHCANGKMSFLSQSQSAFIYFPPIAKFKLDPTGLCPDQESTITNQSKECSGDATYVWNAPNAIPPPVGASPQKIKYAAPGTYNVSMTMTNPDNPPGCQTSTWQETVTVGPPATSAFTFLSPDACVGKPVSVSNTSQNESGWEWDKVSGPGNVIFSPSKTVELPTLTFDKKGKYKIRLKAIGCGTPVSEQEITVRDVASSNPNLSGGCVPYDLEISSNNWPIDLGDCPAASASYTWAVTDPGGSTQTYPGTPYPSASINCNQDGNYKITLTVVNCCGTSTKTADITVKKAAQADFNYTLGTPCIGSGPKTIQFNATSTGTPTVTNKWSISPDPPGSITPSGGLATISQPGTYTVTLTADNGCPPTSTKSETFTIYKTPSAVVANIQPENDCADVTVSFGPQAAPGITQVTYDNGGFAGTDLTYTWNCPDCVPSQQTGQFPTGFLCKQQAQDHVYTFTLTITSPLCGNFTTEKKVTVRVPAKMEIATPNIFCQKDLPQTLQANLPNTLWNLDGQPLPGGIVPASTPVGSYTIEAYRNDGCTTPDTETLTVHKTPAVNADANGAVTLEACVETGFIVLNPTGDFPGDWTSNQPWVTFSGDTAKFSQNGTAILTYTVTDPVTLCKNSDQLTLTVKANENPGVPNVFILCKTPGLVRLPLLPNTNLIYTGPGVDASGQFFDPAAPGLQAQNPVTWKFTNNAGCTATGIMTVQLDDLLPAGELSAGEDKIYCQNGGKIIREGLPLGNPGLVWLDSLGNQISSSGKLELDPSVFKEEILYKVILAYRFPSVNCAQFDTVVLHILFADPDAGPDIQSCPNALPFKLTPVEPPPAGWDFHWTPSDMIDPAAGNQTATLHFTRDGCDFTDEVNITVGSLPESDFTILAPFCSNQGLDFINNTSNAVQQTWFDNGIPFSTDFDPQGYNPPPGQHLFLLVSGSGAGCSDTAQLSIFIEAPPTVSSTPDKLEGCGPLPVTFTYTTTSNDTIDVFFEIWLGNTLLQTVPATGSPQTLPALDPSLSDTTYTIKLIARNDCATVESVHQIKVKARAFAILGFNEDTLCSGRKLDLLCKSLNSSADTLIVDGIKIVTATDTTVSVTVKNTTNQPITLTVYLIAKNDCKIDTTRHDFIIFPNEYEAVAETHDSIPGQKHCEGDSVRLTGHATAGAKVFWTNNFNQKIDGPNINVKVEAGWNEWVLHAEGCGEDTDTVRFFGQAAPMLEFDFLPDVCRDEAFKIEIFSEAGASMLAIFAPGDTAFGSPIFRTVKTAGRLPFSLIAISKEGCPSRIDTALTVRSEPSIPATLTEGCTQKDGFYLKIDDTGDPSVWVKYPSGTVKEGYKYPNLQPGIYQLRYKERVYGCSNDTLMRVDSVREVSVEVFPETDTLTLGESIPLFADGQYVETYAWSPADEVDDPTSFEPLATPNSTGWTSFIVIAEDDRQCQARDTARIFVTHEKVKATFPSAFTPNSDGFNDVLYPRTNQVNAIEWMDFRVYDLNGGQMFVAPDGCLPEDPACGWDGIFRGKEAQMGNYRAIAEFRYLDGTRSVHHKIIRLIR